MDIETILFLISGFFIILTILYPTFLSASGQLITFHDLGRNFLLTIFPIGPEIIDEKPNPSKQVNPLKQVNPSKQVNLSKPVEIGNEATTLPSGKLFKLPLSCSGSSCYDLTIISENAVITEDEYTKEKFIDIFWDKPEIVLKFKISRTNGFIIPSTKVTCLTDDSTKKIYPINNEAGSAEFNIKFHKGETQVECFTGLDKTKNSLSFIVKLSDSKKPTITKIPLEIKQEATSREGNKVVFNFEAEDETGEPAIQCNHRSGSIFNINTTEVICMAIDKSNNTAKGKFDVTVEDTTPPKIGNRMPSKIIAEAERSNGAPVKFVINFTDKVNGQVKANCVPPSGSMFKVGITKVACTGEDMRSNLSPEHYFDVFVNDTKPPMIDMVPKFKLVEKESNSKKDLMTFTISATDNVDKSVQVKCEPSVGSILNSGVTKVQCIASDLNGNTATKDFELMVN
jgi:hypothetical protein